MVRFPLEYKTLRVLRPSLHPLHLVWWGTGTEVYRWGSWGSETLSLQALRQTGDGEKASLSVILQKDDLNTRGCLAGHCLPCVAPAFRSGHAEGALGNQVFTSPAGTVAWQDDSDPSWVSATRRESLPDLPLLPKPASVSGKPVSETENSTSSFPAQSRES